MKPTKDWLKVAVIVIKVIFAIPWGAIVIILRLLGCVVWFLSLGHLEQSAFMPAIFVEDIYLQ